MERIITIDCKQVRCLYNVVSILPDAIVETKVRTRMLFLIRIILLLSSPLIVTAGSVISHGTGFLESPGYPGDYGNNVDVTWRFKVKHGYKIRLIIEHFDIQDSDDNIKGSCFRDFLEVKHSHTANT